MENKPPFPLSSRSGRRQPAMRHSKSSPAKRSDVTRVLTPHYNSTLESDDVFNATGLLTPQASQNTFDAEAAKTLISPPPEDTARPTTSRQSSSWTRAGSEPIAATRTAATTDPGSSSKRKRPIFPSITSRDIDLPNRPQISEASPNPKARKQTRRVRVGSDVEEDRSDGDDNVSPEVSSSAVKQRQGRGLPAASEQDRFRRSRSPSVSPSKSHRNPALLRSPHANNANADYISPVPRHSRKHLSAQARSSTPVPLYEPPAEKFTPPREVFRSSPHVSKSSKRKTALNVAVKKELPEIDLSRPPPPPSPTDDPLLLHGHPRRPRPSIPKHSRETPLLESTPPRPGGQMSPLLRSALDFPLPGIPSDVDDSEDDNIPEPPVFNLANGGEDAWSSSDGGTPEQEGEYTGKFRVMSVPTKADPPTSNTRERIESWGRPISPFPLKQDVIPEEDAAEDETDEASAPSSPLLQPQFHDNQGAADLRIPETLEVEEHDAEEPLSQDEAHQEQPEDTEPPGPADADTGTVLVDGYDPPAHEEQHVGGRASIDVADSDQESKREARGVLHSSAAPAREDTATDLGRGNESTSPGGHASARSIHEAAPSASGAAASPVPVRALDVHADAVSRGSVEEEEEEQEEEDLIDRSLSEEPQVPGPSSWQPTSENVLVEERIEEDEPMVAADDDAESEGDSSDESDLSIVKIVSDDPWAAARAAAILKQHDWDLVNKAAGKRRSSSSVDTLLRRARRADLASAKVFKSASPARSGRRSFGLVVDGRVHMSGSPSMTLPQLLSEAESELGSPTSSSHGHQLFRTPSPAPASFRRAEAPLVIDTDGLRDWTRSDWKLLDACFTDARLEVGARWGGDGVLGDVDAVDLEDVVRRFVDIFGGEDVVAGLGPSFAQENLLKRAKALQRKQRAGEGAPPTPTLRVSSVSSSSTPSVPDFTPLYTARRQGIHSAQPKLSAPQFAGQTTQRVPASLMAPRYSHLLEEAKSLSKHDGPKLRAPADVPGAPLDPVLTDEPAGGAFAPAPEPDQALKAEVPPSPSVGSRVRGLLFSYLPSLAKKPAPATKLRTPALPGMPLPPPEVLEKHRGPVATPPPKPAPRTAHPKELVQLQHAPAPSRIPARARAPKRLVDLRHVSPQGPARTAPVAVPAGRRGSGGSVKELVSSFEELERSAEIEEHALQLRRQKSAGRLADARPAWR
ncbi:hypothetical protein BC834DRAFT_1042177 [Gloeopeniophorella convolvens]|nr:hypothetical protein BC834DRAFT_1042177 [Gloeopeniophorella convolvens]